MISGCSDAGVAWLAALAADLADPPERADAAAVAALWRIDRMRFCCARPPLLEETPDLALRLRGAWGRQLAALPARPRRGWSRPPPYEVLFAPPAALAALPRPFAIRTLAVGDDLMVELSLFGWAGIYLDEAAAALAAALAGGIALGAGVRRRVPMALRDVAAQRVEGVALPDYRVTQATLGFRTPVAVRAGPRLRTAPDAVVSSLLRRVAGLARWQGVALAADLAALDRLAGRLAYDARDLVTTRWRRHSRRGGDRPIPMAGQVGRLRLAGALDPLVPFLAIGETCNTGSHAALGLGCYDLSLTP